MTDATLTEGQALALLRKLATDDDFRKRFQAKPATALVEIGVPPETIVHFAAKCLGPCRIAPKDTFANAVEKLDRNVVSRTMVMFPPWIRLRA